MQKLYDIRSKAAVSIEKACEIAASGGGGGDVVAKKSFDELTEENKKLKYRVSHLLKALDEKDANGGVAPAGAAGGAAKKGYSGPALKMYVPMSGSSSYQMNMV